MPKPQQLFRDLRTSPRVRAVIRGGPPMFDQRGDPPLLLDRLVACVHRLTMGRDRAIAVCVQVRKLIRGPLECVLGGQLGFPMMVKPSRGGPWIAL